MSDHPLPPNILRAIEVARARLLADGVGVERLRCPRIVEVSTMGGVEVLFRCVRDERPPNAHVRVDGLLATLAAPFGGDRPGVRYADDPYAFDPIELVPEHNEVFLKADLLTLDVPDRGEGRCHEIWQRQSTFLASRGIAWRPPDEMNPEIDFD